ncbi:MAG: hypothetical protein JWM58_4461 [Rhizobium sp.]|nr:hypothetical protein [Rhizobium sp.]
MKKILTAAAIGAFSLVTVTPVFALDATKQTETQPAEKIIEQPADTTVKVPEASPDETGAINRVTLEPGENSFTENQAKERIQDAGFTNVGTLTLDEQGIWRGNASKGATSVKVGLDFKGNVAADGATAQ